MVGAARAARFIQNSEFKIQHFFLFHRVTPDAIAADHEDLRPRDQRCVFFQLRAWGVEESRPAPLCKPKSSPKRPPPSAPLPCAMKFWMNSCAIWIGSPTGTPRRMRSLVFMVLVVLEMVGGVHAHFECAAAFVLFVESEFVVTAIRRLASCATTQRLFNSRRLRPQPSCGEGTCAPATQRA